MSRDKRKMKARIAQNEHKKTALAGLKVSFR